MTDTPDSQELCTYIEFPSVFANTDAEIGSQHYRGCSPCLTWSFSGVRLCTLMLQSYRPCGALRVEYAYRSAECLAKGRTFVRVGARVGASASSSASASIRLRWLLQRERLVHDDTPCTGRGTHTAERNCRQPVKYAKSPEGLACVRAAAECWVAAEPTVTYGTMNAKSINSATQKKPPTSVQCNYYSKS